MASYFFGRLVQGVITVIVIVSALFFVVRLTGDPAAMLISPNSTQEELVAFRKRLGLDSSLGVQYASFVRRAFQLDFGASFRQGRPALGAVFERFPATLQLAIAAGVLSVGLGVPLGVLAAIRRGSLIDSVVTVVTLLGQAIPVFWLGLMLILAFSVRLHWLPAAGMGSVWHLILPAVTLGSYSMARITKVTRSAVVDCLTEDYIRTARAKGLKQVVVISKHVMKNAAVPVVTIAALEVGAFLGGSIITETVFSWPGLGRLLVQAVEYRDFPVILAGVFVFCLMIIIINIVVDVPYAALDPRVSYG